jgi:hypothetical protein
MIVRPCPIAELAAPQTPVHMPPGEKLIPLPLLEDLEINQFALLHSTSLLRDDGLLGLGHLGGPLSHSVSCACGLQ